MDLSSPTINPESTVIGTLGLYSPGEVVEDKVVMSASRPNEGGFPPFTTGVCATSYHGCPPECKLFSSCGPRKESGRV